MFRLTNQSTTNSINPHRTAIPSFRLWQGTARNSGGLCQIKRDLDAQLDLANPIAPDAIANYYILNLEQEISKITFSPAPVWQEQIESSTIQLISYQPITLSIYFTAINSSFLSVVNGFLVSEVLANNQVVNFVQSQTNLTVDATFGETLSIFGTIKSDNLVKLSKVLIFNLDLISLSFAEWQGKTYLPASNPQAPEIGEFLYIDSQAFLFCDLSTTVPKIKEQITDYRVVNHGFT